MQRDAAPVWRQVWDGLMAGAAIRHGVRGRRERLMMDSRAAGSRRSEQVDLVAVHGDSHGLVAELHVHLVAVDPDHST
jgi:hypothetical protein